MIIRMGFTLIELIVVIAIVASLLAISGPVSYEYYLNVKENLEAYKIAFKISEVRRNSFFYSKVSSVKTINGKLYIDGVSVDTFFSFPKEQDIVFFKNGTTRGGEILLEHNKNRYSIIVSYPVGEISVEKT